jgi:TRAP-type C4-dicarboxylate transport system permease small subunit
VLFVDSETMLHIIEKAGDNLGRVNAYLLVGCRYAMIFTLAAIFVVVCIGVFFRYVLNNSLVWTEEVAKYTMVWLAFIGSPVAMEKGGHVAIEMLFSRAKGVFKLFLILVIQIIIISVLVLLLWKGVDLAVKAIPQHSTALTWLSLIWVYLAVPVGAALMLPVTIQHCLNDIVQTFQLEGTALETAESRAE